MSKTAILYPREVICGGCGIAMILGFHNPYELSQGGDPVYVHPQHHCEFSGKRLIPAGIFAGIDSEEED